MTVPVGFDGDGLPIGLQIVASWLREDLILHIAAVIEKIRPWAHIRPTLKKAAANA